MATSNSGEGSQSMATSSSGEGSQSMATSSSDLHQSIDHLGFLRKYGVDFPLIQELRPRIAKEDNPCKTSTRFVVTKVGTMPPLISSFRVHEAEPSQSLYGNVDGGNYFKSTILIGLNFLVNQEPSPRTKQVENPIISPSRVVQCPKCVSLAKVAKVTSCLIGLLGDRRSEIPAEKFEDIFELMIDENGHHAFTQLLDLFNEADVNYILHNLVVEKELLISASLYTYGIPSVLKLIEVCQDKPFILELTQALGLGMYTLLTHENGKHVVLKCLTILTNEQNDAIYVALMQDCRSLVRHEIGCISICECIDALKNPQRADLLGAVLMYLDNLTIFSPGIHVLKHVVEVEYNTTLASEICFKLKPLVKRLSTTKEGSELLQTCLTSIGKRHVIEGILDTKYVIEIAQDTYGLHLIENALNTNVDEKLHLSLLKPLQPHMEALKFHPGRVIYDLIKNEVPLDEKTSHRGKCCVFCFPEDFSTT